MILMGDEAVAQAAIDAGISGAFSYPGTPATEIFEYVEMRKPKDREIYTRWSTNEKVAYEEALGMSYCGKRSIVSMKHVGLNVAADPFMNSGITGANGGLVVIVADDPGMHSSQNEQDSRYYSAFGYVPCFEPSNQQEAYDMTYEAVRLSEEIRLPIMIRLVTRLAHSRSSVTLKERIDQNPIHIAEDPRHFTLLPVNARKNFAELTARWDEVEKRLWELPFNRLELEGKELGIIASGVGFNYFMENAVQVGKDYSFLKVGTFPIPIPMVEQLMDHCDEILVIEDGYPFIEDALRGALNTPKKPIHGKRDGWLPRTGELDPTSARKALKLDALSKAHEPVEGLSGRPPALCKGCPHVDTYKAIGEILEVFPEGRVLSDIGCYTLGALPPFQAIHSCVDMGASVSMANGAAAAGVFPSFAVIGDSTFAHSGITPLIDAVDNNSNIVVIIVDNSITAMTGRQPSAMTGDRLVSLLEGVGVDPEHIRVINPLPQRHSETVKIFKEEIAYEGLSVIIPRRPCIQIRKK
jgi:indolepyruvate ferredoxin oxidoreductase alpha subunit